ncbi:hypothetical protein NP233_g7634 [Leucocoprinus birnbaumii]|uniref:Uncharacterized protein n=1 Tax=Leucocoprinus birnbaumii TaxID=56174 RepID=A0AAD5VQE9_9AGAR|nr:hypothetical protein NP233_g7634 [Leucocoprinus birnbaumii]
MLVELFPVSLSLQHNGQPQNSRKRGLRGPTNTFDAYFAAFLQKSLCNYHSQQQTRFTLCLHIRPLSEVTCVEKTTIALSFYRLLLCLCQAGGLEKWKLQRARGLGLACSTSGCQSILIIRRLDCLGSKPRSPKVVKNLGGGGRQRHDRPSLTSSKHLDAREAAKAQSRRAVADRTRRLKNLYIEHIKYVRLKRAKVYVHAGTKTRSSIRKAALSLSSIFSLASTITSSFSSPLFSDLELSPSLTASSASSISEELLTTSLDDEDTYVVSDEEKFNLKSLLDELKDRVALVGDDEEPRTLWDEIKDCTDHESADAVPGTFLKVIGEVDEEYKKNITTPHDFSSTSTVACVSSSSSEAIDSVKLAIRAIDVPGIHEVNAVEVVENKQDITAPEDGLNGVYLGVSVPRTSNVDAAIKPASAVDE